MQTVDQMREYLINQYGYSSEDIPLSFGGSFDPSVHGHARYQTCLSVVTNSRSICSTYYSLDYQSTSKTKSMSSALFHHSDRQESIAASLLSFVSLDRTADKSVNNHPRKRESSASSDNEKRRRSNVNFLNEEQIEASSSHLSNIPPSDTSDE